MTDQTRLTEVLERTFGFSTFRPLQQEIISGLLDGENTFVLMPTGGGKSLCYQLPALIFDGLTVVVSPLIALMKDQVDALVDAGVPATFINSSLPPDEIDRRKRGILEGETKILYVAPERLLTPGFLALLDAVELSLLAVDEAHCISEWGHDFRAEYRQLATVRERYPETTVVAMTATANDRVREDILAQLDLGDARIYIAGFDRPNLHYSVRQRSRAIVDQIIEVAKRNRGESGIVYCHSRAETERLARLLDDAGYSALPYHAGLDRERRAANQEAFERDEVDIICATVAFGMGIDKPDVRFVVHSGIPKNLMGYYQETGRAGRDDLPSECVLLYSRGDRGRIFHFINQMSDPKEQRIAMAGLDEMVGYAESGDCRRRVLLGYFGEEYPEENCEGCDNCDNPDAIEEVDATREAQMFLSTVVRLRESFGMKYTIDVLRGSQNEKILNNRHTEISTYGIGADRPLAEWKWLGGALIAAGYASQRPERFSTLQVTPQGWAVLKGEEEVRLRRHKETTRSRPTRRRGELPELPEANRRLYEHLRTIRKRIAEAQDVPPWVVFGDRTLYEMAGRLPSSDEDLLGIHGIGYEKARRHGPRFLDEVARFVEATPEIAPMAGIPRTETRAKRVTDGISSTALETDALRRQGLTIEQIAAQRNLKPVTIEGHFADLVTAGRITSIDEWVSPDRQQQIRELFEALGTERLTPVLKRLGGEEVVSWLEVKLVRAVMEGEAERE